MPVTITVPEKINAGFVIATNLIPDDIPAAIRQNLPAPFMEPVLERLGTPEIEIAEHRAPASPWDLTKSTATDQEHSEMAQRATWHIGVLSELQAIDLPAGLHLARVAAEALAESVCGIPVDLGTGLVLPRGPSGAARNFVLADEWIRASLPPYRNDGRCQADGDELDGCTCVDIRTRGLFRFGLPELEIVEVACSHDLAALNIVRTTAQHLLPLGRHPGEHFLPSELRLTSDDFSDFWGSKDSMWDDGPVPVQLVQKGPHLLGIEAPDDFAGTMSEWLWDAIPPILHELLSCEPGDPDPT